MIVIHPAKKEDLREILEMQKIAFLQEAKLYNNYNIQPMTQNLDEIQLEYDKKIFLKAVDNKTIIGSVRAEKKDGYCRINKLLVHPAYQNKGIGTKLMMHIEKYFKDEILFKLETGAQSFNNIHLYEKLGFKIIKKGFFHDGVEAVFMEKKIEL